MPAGVFTVVHAVGLCVSIAGMALLRRERETARDLDRPMNPSCLTVGAALLVVGGAVVVWGILAS